MSQMRTRPNGEKKSDSRLFEYVEWSILCARFTADGEIIPSLGANVVDIACWVERNVEVDD